MTPSWSDREAESSLRSDVGALLVDLRRRGANGHGNPVANLRYRDAADVIDALLAEDQRQAGEVERLTASNTNLLGEQVAGIEFMRERDVAQATVERLTGIIENVETRARQMTLTPDHGDDSESWYMGQSDAAYEFLRILNGEPDNA